MSEKIEIFIKNHEKIQDIRFLILDVDGVMTDGSIGYTANGDELKVFNVKDGAGVKYWFRAGHHTGIITGRTSKTVLRRGEELGISLIAMDAKNKLPAAEKMLADAGVNFSEAAVIGDDLPDIPLIRRAGLGIAVNDAVQEVKDAADCVTNTNGGRGAVREVIEQILKAQNRWAALMERYLQ
jgi:3-deoxy-D-manno-octulosonate 8-phosphate phosphatase, YrbI family